MKILLVHGIVKQLASEDILRTLEKLGHEVREYQEVLEPGFLDDDKIAGLVNYIEEERIELAISIYFVMNAALAAYKKGIKYVAVIWDAPYVGVYNPLSRIDNVYISTFDRLERDRYLAHGIKNVLYQPLCVNRDSVREWDHDIQDTLRGGYFHDISFVGRLYDGNEYDRRRHQIPQGMQEYFTSIFEEAAFKWDGVNRVIGSTSDDIWKYLELLNPDFKMVNRMDIEDARCFEAVCLVWKIANIERVAVLNALAEEHSVAVYTDSHSAEEALSHVELRPPVITGKAVALVFAGSRINLNIALKGMEGGTPLRVMDITAAGGFALSSYCPETADLFEEDKEIVLFRSPEELMEKADYYLRHDAERERIAAAGRRKTLSCYTYEKKLQQLIDWVEHTA